MTDKHPDCEYRCQLKEHKGYRDCNETGVCHFMTDSKKEELLKLCETAAHADNNSGPRLLRRLAKEMKSLLTERDAERAGFLRQHPIGSINEAGYHFVNAQTEKDRVEWWNILKERIVAAVTNRPSREGQPFGNLAAAPKQEKPTYEEREQHACKVCGNVPDEIGMISHGRGCYTQNEDGGGESFVDLKQEKPE